MSNYQICKRCVMDTSDAHIHFDQNGICDRCRAFDETILPGWNYGKGKEAELTALLDKIKQDGIGKPYDCLLGMSGGFDSSYMLHMAVKEWGLRPLVFHVDAGWNLPVGVNNITKMVNKLGIDLKIEKIDWKDERNFQLAFFRSGLASLDIPQDHAFVSVLDRFAVDNDIKYILNGGNISTEVIVNPESWSRNAGKGTDMRFINDIIKQHSDAPLKNYPFTNVLRRKIYLPYVKGVKVVKPLDLLPYIKKDAENLLKCEYDWEPYAQKHFESIMTKFIEGYWNPKRFGFDVRRPQFSSLILTSQMTRDEALEKLQTPPMTQEEELQLFDQVAQMLEISTTELQGYMNMPLWKNHYKNSNWLFSIGAKIMFVLKMDKLIRK